MRSSSVRPSVSLRHAVAAVLALSAVSFQLTQQAAAQEAASEDVATLSDVNVADDPMRAMFNEPSASSTGFAKPLLETPRTVTFVSEEQIRLFGVSTVEDLSRLVPGTYTTTRYGLQGGVSVRGVSADFYYRGMKRLQMQGHVRTVLSAYDNIEVIKGPPMPIFGMGKIGGYANLEPKSGRARTGKYMTDNSGYLQATVGSYNKAEMQFGLGVPFTVGNRASAVYFVGLLEDSGTYVRTVPAKQKFLQGTGSIDNAIGPFRFETGGQVQRSITAGAYFARVTQDMIDNGRYVVGQPLSNLDVNGDGRIGYVETFLGSPVTVTPGNAFGAANAPLSQRYNLTVNDKNALGSYKGTINGIPETMKNYLLAHPEVNCSMATHMRSAAVASVAGNPNGLVSRTLPVGFVLNPCTTGVTTLTDGDYRANGAYEREQNAMQRMFYADLIYDTNPDFTVKNQFFYDSLSSFKDSWLPYGENQAIRAVEDKITVTKRLPAAILPDWLRVNSLGSVNYRRTAGYIRSSGGDFDYRQDIKYNQMLNGMGQGGFYPNTMFWTQLTNNSYQTGTPNTADRTSEYDEKGVGLMFDVDVFKNTNLVLGWRYDWVSAEARNFAAFNQTSGNLAVGAGSTIEAMQAAYRNGSICQQPGAFSIPSLSGTCPGVYLAPGITYKSSEGGRSYNVSLSHQLPWGGMRPYLTYAKTKIILDSSNNLFTDTQARDGLLVGEASIKEAGIKGALMRGKLQWTLSAFEQERTDVSGGSDPTVDAFATSTNTKGVEAGVNYQVTKKWFVGASATEMKARYVAGAVAQNFEITAREAGWTDIVDPDGNIYPAEAFGYGGRTAVTLTDLNNVYDEVPGAPEWQAAVNTTYQLTKSLQLLGNVQYTGDVWANRIQTVKAPSYTLLNLGANWDHGKMHLKGNVYNVTDKTTFRPGGGNSSLQSVLPDRRYEVQLKVDF